MASSGKKKTTMAKLQRESRLRERRMEKDARKRARKDAAAHPPVDSPPLGEDATEAGAPGDTADTDRPTAAIAHQDASPPGSSA
jgi:hypothetical protein